MDPLNEWPRPIPAKANGLTTEQIEAAAKELWLRCPQEASGIWETIDVKYRIEWRRYAVAIAPLLQIPWEPPTGEEETNAITLAQEFRAKTDEFRTRHAIRAFVIARNAALLPKPVDPRREAIIRAMEIRSRETPSYETLADRVIAALDSIPGEMKYSPSNPRRGETEMGS